MIKRIRSLFYLIFIIGSLNISLIYFESCKQDFVNTPNNVTQFPPEVEAVFNTPYTTGNITCNTPSCHADGNTNGMNLVDWQKAMNGSNNGTMIIPYNGFWSHMIAVLNADTNYAPVITITLPEVHKIDTARIHVIMNWINNGAKSKDGQIAFTSIPNSEKGFITNQAADLVAVVETKDKLVTRLIPVGGIGNTLNTPHYITLSPDNRYFYVSLIGAGYVQKFDANTYSQVGISMQAGQSPAHIVISADGSTGYVTNFSSDHLRCGITKFDANNMTVISTLTDLKMPGIHGMALSNNGQYLYSTSQVGEYMFKINTNYFTTTDSLIKGPLDPSVPPSGDGTSNFRPYQLVLSPDNSLIFVSCTSANQIRVYRSSDLAQINSIPVGMDPRLMQFTNDGRYLFVCNRVSNSVSVINTSTLSVQTTITDVGVQPHGVDFTSDGKYAIISCETQAGDGGHHPQVGNKRIGVSRMIQVSDFTLLPNRLEMGSFPAGIAIIK